MNRQLDWLLEIPLAHRGLHDLGTGVPENSLTAFARAADQGFPVEFDVHLAADGVPVVVHDAELERITGRSGVVTDLTSDELAGHTILGTEHHIPTLVEVLEVIGGRVGAMVELKNYSRNIGPLESAVHDVLRHYAGPHCIASFNPATVAWYRRNASEIPRGQTAAALDEVEELPGWLRPLLRVMVGNPVTGPEFLSYELRGLPNAAVSFWRSRGLPLVTWTATTPAEVVKARAVADNFIFEGVVP